MEIKGLKQDHGVENGSSRINHFTDAILDFPGKLVFGSHFSRTLTSP